MLLSVLTQQRFGRQGQNLQRVDDWFVGGKTPRKRNQKSMYLSSARSWLFNLVLDERIQKGNWNQPLEGDVMLLAGTKASLFNADNIDEAIQHRIDTMDIHPTGPMWGRGQPQTQMECFNIEQKILADWTDWQQGLEKVGLKQERRSLRLFAHNLDWQYLDEEQLELTFFLPAGSYATSVMRELAIITDVQKQNYHGR